MPTRYIRVRAVVWAYGWGQTDRQTHRQTHRRLWPQYILRRLWLTQNVINEYYNNNSSISLLSSFPRRYRFTMYVTDCDLEKSYSFSTRVEIRPTRRTLSDSYVNISWLIHRPTIFPNAYKLARFQIAKVTSMVTQARSLIIINTIRQDDFLLVFRCIYVLILYRFRDIITYLPNIKEVTWPWTHPFQW